MLRTFAIVCAFSVAMGASRLALAESFSAGDARAVKFGVHEVVLTGDGGVSNPFDTIVSVRFTPPSGAGNSQTVWGFFDGGNTWRARVYLSETGEWTWSSTCDTDPGLNARSGKFQCDPSELPGRLLAHPKNPRQWITEDGRWFLNLNDTAYFLLCAHDGNGVPVSDEDAQQYIRDDVSRGITSVRCFLASRKEGFAESAEEWRDWFFPENTFDQFRLDNLQCADRRLQMLLDDHPEVAVQLIMFPLERYAQDDRFWAALTTNQRERLLRCLVARYAAYPQLLWLITNDAHYGPTYPHSNAMVREVGAFLQQHDAWQHPRSTGHARRLPFFFGGDDWATYIHIEHAHDLGALQYSQYHGFAKPVFLGEDRYEQDHGPPTDPVNMRYWQRRLFWAWLLSGGSTNYGGRWWAVHPYSTTGARPATYHKRPNVTFRAALTGLDSVRHIRDFFEQRGIDLGQFAPDHVLARDADGRSESQSPRLLRRGTDEYLVYHPNAAADERAAAVDTSKAASLELDLRQTTGTFRVEWYRALDGQSHDGAAIAGGQVTRFTSPWPGHDTVLRLTRSSQD